MAKDDARRGNEATTRIICVDFIDRPSIVIEQQLPDWPDEDVLLDAMGREPNPDVVAEARKRGLII